MTRLPSDRESDQQVLEDNGIPTVVIGTARDIAEHCGVARFSSSIFRLEAPCGEPGAVGQQREVFQMALDLLSRCDGTSDDQGGRLQLERGRLKRLHLH